MKAFAVVCMLAGAAVVGREARNAPHTIDRCCAVHVAPTLRLRYRCQAMDDGRMIG
jgi:hypothetical protein